jgi:hypothetical protein
MNNRTRMLLGAFTAALVLASAIGTASANRLSISNKAFRVTWTPLTYGTSVGGGGTQVVCNVTMEGSFHYNTIVKVLRSLIGYITKASIGHPCSGAGEAWTHNGVEEAGLGAPFRNNLPWHVTYEGFEGRLPEIIGVRILFRPLLTISVFGVLCEYFNNSQAVIKLGRGGEATSLIPDATFAKLRTSGGFLCPRELFPTANSASSRITLLGSDTLITIRLI